MTNYQIVSDYDLCRTLVESQDLTAIRQAEDEMKARLKRRGEESDKFPKDQSQNPK